MCEFCDEDPPVGCPDCGRLICWDIKQGDDIIAPAAVTSSGDLMCLCCAREYERLEEEEAENEPYSPGPWDDYEDGQKEFPR